MSQYRKHYRITYEGVVHDVVTSAADWATAEQDEGAQRPMDLVFQILHACCIRLKVDGVPRAYAAFLDGLDDFDDLDDKADEDTDQRPIHATA